VPPHAYRAALVEAQAPAALIELALYLFITQFDGRNTPVRDGIQRALGRAPSDFADFANRAAADGVWRARDASTSERRT
jgi:hypothetical protein